jgi:hypothetical protein
MCFVRLQVPTTTKAGIALALDPFTDANLLFFAAWPMLAACIALFLLREHDTLLSIGTLRR